MVTLSGGLASPSVSWVFEGIFTTLGNDVGFTNGNS